MVRCMGGPLFCDFPFFSHFPFSSHFPIFPVSFYVYLPLPISIHFPIFPFAFDVDLPLPIECEWESALVLFAFFFPYPVTRDGDIGLTAGFPEPGIFFDASEEEGAAESRRWPPLGKLQLEMKDRSRPSEH